MKFRLFILILAFNWLIWPADPVNAAQEGVKIARSGNTVLHTVCNNKQVDITFHITIIDKSNNEFPFYALFPDIKEWEFRTVHIVKKMEISVDGKKISVPWGVFADLIDPWGA